MRYILYIIWDVWASYGLVKYFKLFIEDDKEDLFSVLQGHALSVRRHNFRLRVSHYSNWYHLHTHKKQIIVLWRSHSFNCKLTTVRLYWFIYLPGMVENTCYWDATQTYSSGQLTAVSVDPPVTVFIFFQFRQRAKRHWLGLAWRT